MTMYKWGKYEKKSNYRTETKEYIKRNRAKTVRTYRDSDYYIGHNDYYDKLVITEGNPFLYTTGTPDAWGNENDGGKANAKEEELRRQPSKYRNIEIIVGQKPNIASPHYFAVCYDEITTYTETVFSGYYKGSYIGTETSSSRNAYPNNGEKDGYWYVYEGIANQGPVISGSDSFIGNKFNNFTVEYIVTDPDSDDKVNVEILFDDKDKESYSNIGLGVRRYINVDVSKYTLGNHSITIKATDSQGASSTRKFTWTKINNAPIISGSDKDLGGKNTAFSIVYQVSDTDGDKISVVEKLNGLVLRNISNASQNSDLSLNISTDQVQALEIGKVNTIEIEVSDTKGGVNYRRYTFKRDNFPPIISDTDKDLGIVKDKFTYKYSVTDTEKDPLRVSIFIDDANLERNKSIEDGKEYTVELKDLDFLKLRPGVHTLRIEANDGKNPSVVRLVNFTRKVDRLVMVSAQIKETDAAAKRIYLNPVWLIAVGAEGKIEVSNNAFDKSPTWEDATSTVKAGKTFNFQNTSKTASKWGICVKMTVNRNQAKVFSYIQTMGGAFE